MHPQGVQAALRLPSAFPEPPCAFLPARAAGGQVSFRPSADRLPPQLQAFLQLPCEVFQKPL